MVGVKELVRVGKTAVGIGRVGLGVKVAGSGDNGTDIALVAVGVTRSRTPPFASSTIAPNR